MSVASEINGIERRLSSAGVSVRSLCEAAEVNQSTWTRWKSGSNTPNMATWGRVQDALEAILSAKDAA